MSKFIERAEELIERLERFRNTNSLENEIAVLCAKDEVGYTSAAYDRDSFKDCILDVRIFIYEFGASLSMKSAKKLLARMCPHRPLFIFLGS